MNNLQLSQPDETINTFAQKLKNIDFINIKEWQAKHAADLLFGQGVILNSDNEQIKKYLNDFAKFNQLDDLLLEAAKDAAYGGRVVFTIDKTEGGQFLLSYANNELLQQILKIEITPFAAKLIKKKVVGLNVFFIFEEWDDEKVIRSFEIQTKNDKEPRPATKEDFKGIDDIPKELRVPKMEFHKLGFVPFVEFLNKPRRNIILTNKEGNIELQDDYPVRFMSDHINHGLRQWFKEEVLGRTRAFAFLTEAELAKLKNENKELGLLADLIISTLVTEGNKQFEFQGATFNHVPWSEGTISKINMYFMACGYSMPFPTTANPTEAETLLSKDYDIKTTKSKRRRWQVVLDELIAKLLVYEGFAENVDAAKELFTLEIKENVVYNKLQLAEFLNANIEYGLMSRAEAIQMQRDLPDIKEAEEIKEMIDKDREENAELEGNIQAELVKNMPSNDTGNMGKLSPKKDSSPNSEETD